MIAPGNFIFCKVMNYCLASLAKQNFWLELLDNVKHNYNTHSYNKKQSIYRHEYMFYIWNTTGGHSLEQVYLCHKQNANILSKNVIKHNCDSSWHDTPKEITILYIVIIITILVIFLIIFIFLIIYYIYKIE